MDPQEEAELRELAKLEREEHAYVARTQARQEAASNLNGVVDDVMAEVDARLAEANLAKREAYTEAGAVPVDLGVGGRSAEAPTWETIQERYGDGDPAITTEAYLAAQEQHERERRF